MNVRAAKVRFFYCVSFERRPNIANPKKGKQTVWMNEDIHFREVRLIDEDGEMRGVVATTAALDRAESVGLDLVLISADPQNPVCRIMDYGKYAFEQSKREREAKKKQKVTDLKEVQLKLTTEEHDLSVKVKNAVRFLEGEDRVRVVIRFRGREMTYQNRGIDVMKAFAQRCEEYGSMERPPRVEGRNMVMYLAPLTAKEKKERERVKQQKAQQESQTVEA